VLLVLDAAYAEYGRRGRMMARWNWPAARTMCWSRGLFKIHGLAAERIGWGYAHADIIDADEPDPAAVQCHHHDPEAAVAAGVEILSLAAAGIVMATMAGRTR
jgi:histidinol-phosphate aminotransferase